MLPVGLCEWEITNVHPVLTKMFKNNLKTFENESSKYLRTFSLSPKIERSYDEKECKSFRLFNSGQIQIIDYTVKNGLNICVAVNIEIIQRSENAKSKNQLFHNFSS